jgi:hypothetical protein
MALSDVVEVIVEFVDLASSWRFFLPTAIGIVAAWVLIEWLGASTMSFVLAGIVGAAGLCIGGVWQWHGGDDGDCVLKRFV